MCLWKAVDKPTLTHCQGSANTHLTPLCVWRVDTDHFEIIEKGIQIRPDHDTLHMKECLECQMNVLLR